MGVRRLRHHLRSYATRTVLDGEPLIIDGPALAYHIHKLCTLETLSVPSSDALAEACLNWLDKLTSHGIEIKAVYFDGHLPAGKVPTRIGRLVSKTADLKQLYQLNLAGCPTNALVLNNDASSAAGTPHQQYRWLPHNPLTVQVILETLKTSSRYGHLAHLVPGEADGFCAALARMSNAFIITGDTDLLIYDIGDSGVIFFDDLNLRTEVSELRCLASFPSRIATRLGLPGSGRGAGIRRLAFELERAPHVTLPELLASCCDPVDECGFTAFLGPYRGDEVAGELASIASSLGSVLHDPRVSELVLQFGPPLAHTSLSEPQGNAEDTVRMFLPNPVENYSRTSCFDISTTVRQIAYSLLRSEGTRSPSGIREFKRLHEGSARSGSLVSLLGASDLRQRILDLAETLSNILPLADDEHLWPAVAFELETAHALPQGKKVLAKTATRLLPRNISRDSRMPWDVIHFHAEAEACCYSFKLLDQALLATRAHGDGAYTHVRDMCRPLEPYLSRVPRFTAFPTLKCTLDFLRVAYAAKTPSMAKDTPVSAVKGPTTAGRGMLSTGSRGKGGSRSSLRSGLGAEEPSIIQNRFCLLDTEHDC